jgi:hypothetical protein
MSGKPKICQKQPFKWLRNASRMCFFEQTNLMWMKKMREAALQHHLDGRTREKAREKRTKPGIKG